MDVFQCGLKKKRSLLRHEFDRLELQWLYLLHRIFSVRFWELIVLISRDSLIPEKQNRNHFNTTY